MSYKYECRLWLLSVQSRQKKKCTEFKDDLLSILPTLNTPFPFGAQNGMLPKLFFSSGKIFQCINARSSSSLKTKSHTQRNAVEFFFSSSKIFSKIKCIDFKLTKQENIYTNDFFRNFGSPSVRFIEAEMIVLKRVQNKCVTSTNAGFYFIAVQ